MSSASTYTIVTMPFISSTAVSPHWAPGTSTTVTHSVLPEILYVSSDNPKRCSRCKHNLACLAGSLGKSFYPASTVADHKKGLRLPCIHGGKVILRAGFEHGSF